MRYALVKGGVRWDRVVGDEMRGEVLCGTVPHVYSLRF